ncbi:MAG: MOSC N-terminal beta barrel domain-containing protein [Planctomycetota bacterium]
MPKLSRITIYPIKSFDGLEVETSEVPSHGALAEDRRWALAGVDGRVITSESTPAVCSIDARWRQAGRSLAVSASDGEQARFDLPGERAGLEAWMAAALGQECEIEEDAEGGFPYDKDACGPTIISTATLEEVASWLPGMTIDSMRRRFRTNLEIDAPEPFWEDRLVGKTFQVGSIHWVGTNVCQRCVVPARNPDTGEPLSGFQKTVAQRRRETLPDWSPAEQFNHYYRVAINTKPAEGFTPGVVTVGDEVVIHE